MSHWGSIGEAGDIAIAVLAGLIGLAVGAAERTASGSRAAGGSALGEHRNGKSR